MVTRAKFGICTQAGRGLLPRMPPLTRPIMLRYNYIFGNPVHNAILCTKRCSVSKVPVSQSANYRSPDNYVLLGSFDEVRFNATNLQYISTRRISIRATYEQCNPPQDGDLQPMERTASDFRRRLQSTALIDSHSDGAKCKWRVRCACLPPYILINVVNVHREKKPTCLPSS